MKKIMRQFLAMQVALAVTTCSLWAASTPQKTFDNLTNQVQQADTDIKGMVNSAKSKFGEIKTLSDDRDEIVKHYARYQDIRNEFDRLVARYYDQNENPAMISGMKSRVDEILRQKKQISVLIAALERKASNFPIEVKIGNAAKSFYVDLNIATVATLKEKIESSEKIPFSEQTLIYSGKKMNDNDSLSSFDLRTRIWLVTKSQPREQVKQVQTTQPPAQPLPGQVRQISVKIPIKNKTLSIYINPDIDSVATLKEKIEARENIPFNQQRLIQAGSSMDDNRMLSDYNLNETIHLVVTMKILCQIKERPFDNYAAPIKIEDPYTYEIYLNKSAKFGDLKNELAKASGLTPNDIRELHIKNKKKPRLDDDYLPASGSNQEVYAIVRPGVLQRIQYTPKNKPSTEPTKPTPSKNTTLSGAHTEIGKRPTNEDAHAIAKSSDGNFEFFAVYDGHGGAETSNILANGSEQIPTLHNFIFEKIKTTPISAKMISDAFIEYDNMLKKERIGAGSTATVVIRDVKNNKLYFANLGDSRTILANDDKSLALKTEDQKPNNPEERKRIQSAGGHVIFGRVNGTLATARAFGDFDIKFGLPNNPTCMSEPVVTEIQLTPNSDFMVLACDGVWDVMSNEDVIDLIKQQRNDGKTAEEAAKELVNTAIKNPTQRDNVSAVVVFFN